MASELVMERSTKGLIEARAPYDNDELDKALEMAEELLEDHDIPRYHRIKCHNLITACVDDWEDASDLLAKSVVLWQMARQLVTRRGCEMGVERDEDVELALAELRDEIDSLKRQHDAERSDKSVDV